VCAKAINAGSEPRIPHQQLRVKTFLMIVIMIFTGPLGNVLLAKGMKGVGAPVVWPPSEVFSEALRIFASPFIWLGIGSLITFFISYMLVLSWADYSYVQPASSLAYGVVALLGYLALGEKVSLLHWAGIGTISLGVFFVSRTHPRTTPRPLEGEA
jgi:drug/metabolite transporter (DMT)-like permease